MSTVSCSYDFEGYMLCIVCYMLCVIIYFFLSSFLTNGSSYLTSDSTSDHFFFVVLFCFLPSSARRGAASLSCVSNDFFERVFTSASVESMTKKRLSCGCWNKENPNLTELACFYCCIMYVLFHSFDVYPSVKRFYLKMPWYIFSNLAQNTQSTVSFHSMICSRYRLL